MPNGSVFTGFYSNWRELPEYKRNKVQAAREKKNLGNQKNNKVSEIKTLIKEVESLKRSIAQIDTFDADNNAKMAEDAVPNDAGTQFGGRNKKKKMRCMRYIH